MIVTGDPSQVDLPYGQVSGLAEATRLLANVEGIEHVIFTAQDVVRHELVGRIVEAYDKAALASARDAQAVNDDADRTWSASRPTASTLEIGVAPGAAALDATLAAGHRGGDRRRQRGRRAGAGRASPWWWTTTSASARSTSCGAGSTSRPTCCRFPTRTPSPGPERYLGDIAISYETAAREAAAEGKSLGRSYGPPVGPWLSAPPGLRSRIGRRRRGNGSGSSAPFSRASAFPTPTLRTRPRADI